MRKAVLAALALLLTAVPSLAFQPSTRYAVDPRALGISYTDVQFPSSRDTVLLHGWWFAGRDSAPVLVVCPSENGNMADKLPSVREWVRLGYNVLAFDLRDSGPASVEDTDTLRQVVFSSRWVNDTEGALWFARSRAGGRPVAAWGQDLGGVLAFVASGRAKGNADAIATEGLFRTSQEQLLWLGASQDPELVRRHRILVYSPDEPVSVAARQRAPMVVVLAGKDEVTPQVVTRQLIAMVPAACETWVLPDAGHEHAERTPGYFDHVGDAIKRALQRGRRRIGPR
jgi:alpha-beta hydrolase superfamily lysophospholipase